jgi:hypothetical protein
MAADIPIYVQDRAQPDTAEAAGSASPYARPWEVANIVGIPRHRLIETRIVRQKGERHWLVVAA